MMEVKIQKTDVLDYTSALGWTEKDVDKGNALIAQFMGYKYDSRYEEWYMEKPLTYYGKDMGGIEVYNKTRTLRYHCSWDWLIPACQKFCNYRPAGMNKREHNKMISDIRYGLYWAAIGATFYHLVTKLKQNKWPKTQK